MNPPDLSIVMPVFNRGEVIRYSLESVRRATGALTIETIVVDDGSDRPVALVLDQLGYRPTRLIRQHNQGLLFARLTGLAAATGRHVLFLDSDDLVSADKLEAQVAAMDRTGAEVSYTDSAHTLLDGDYDALVITPEPPLRTTDRAADFFIDVQPAPHCPMLRRDYLQRIVHGACFPPSPLYNPVAEIWFYHIAAPHAARVVHVPGPRAIVGRHPGTRLTNNWERLAVASLAVMEAFARTCPTNTPDARRASELVGEKAFRSWRRLPRDFSPRFAARELAVWRRLATARRRERLGGGLFQTLSRFFGPVNAGRILRRLRGDPYATCRTLDDATLTGLLDALPPGD